MDWDKGLPPIALWQEALRVLKPGGNAFVFVGTRTQHRMGVNIEDAGFDIIDTLMWLYSGFIKSLDIGKAIDKHLGIEHPRNNLDGIVDRVSKQELKTPQAQAWRGYGSTLKPGYEPIIWARKKCEGTFAKNALKYGVAGLNLNGAMIPIIKEKETDSRVGTNIKRGAKKGIKKGTSIFGCSDEGVQMYKEGRLPANVIMTDDVGKMLDEQTGELGFKQGVIKHYKPSRYGFGGTKKGIAYTVTQEMGDRGGASRFYKNIPMPSRIIYVPKAHRNERELGCVHLELKETTICTSDDTNFKTGAGNDRDTKRHNFHPTVKPLLLMEYLCTMLSTPTGGKILDPFMGSGTTGVACVNTDLDFIGIEQNEDYMNIANARIEYAMNHKGSRPDLF